MALVRLSFSPAYLLQYPPPAHPHMHSSDRRLSAPKSLSTARGTRLRARSTCWTLRPARCWLRSLWRRPSRQTLRKAVGCALLRWVFSPLRLTLLLSTPAPPLHTSQRRGGRGGVQDVAARAAGGARGLAPEARRRAGDAQADSSAGRGRQHGQAAPGGRVSSSADFRVPRRLC